MSSTPHTQRLVCVVVATVLAGCAAIEEFHQRPVRQPDGSYRPAQSAQKPGQAAVDPPPAPQLCQKYNLRSTIDVDMAYVRAVKEFGFVPVEEIERNIKGRPFILAQGLKHNKTPGIMYNMAQGVTVAVGEKKVSPWMNMDIVKARAGSVIAGDFCYVDRGVGDVRQPILAKLEATFKE
jgi:hypothetical protein